MPKLANRLPKMCKHGNRAVVSLSGQQVYLGRWGTAKATAEYERKITEWLARGKTPYQVDTLTVNHLLVAYLKFAKGYYRKNGRITNEFTCMKNACKVLRSLYGSTAADEFGPLALEAVRNAMIEKGWSRKQINKQVGRLVRVFRWGVSKELIPTSVHEALKSVEGLKKGRCDAKETAPIHPVSDEVVEKTIPFLLPIVADMVRLHRLLGCRPGELCQIRPMDIDRSTDVWIYRPEEHKTEHLGRERRIFIGPKAQEILKPYLDRAADSYCFSPAETEAMRREDENAKRSTPLSCGNRRGTNRKVNPQRRPGDRYTKDSYGKAIRRACEKAFPPPPPLARRQSETKAAWQNRLKSDGLWEDLLAWNSSQRWAPNQLRHTRATEIRRQAGIEGAQVALGHSDAQVTQIYAERDMKLAEQIARETG